jgi:hypothetical protein
MTSLSDLPVRVPMASFVRPYAGGNGRHRKEKPAAMTRQPDGTAKHAASSAAASSPDLLRAYETVSDPTAGDGEIGCAYDAIAEHGGRSGVSA